MRGDIWIEKRRALLRARGLKRSSLYVLEIRRRHNIDAGIARTMDAMESR